VIGGGNNNTINAPYGVIPGGSNNRINVGADYSFVAGRNGVASGAGTFIWSDLVDDYVLD
jgi:hypothetical protein